MSVTPYTTWHAKCDNTNWSAIPGKRLGHCPWDGGFSFETKSEAANALRAHAKECEYKS